MTSDGSQAVSASDDKTLMVWDLRTGTILHTLGGHEGPVNDVVVTADGSQAVSASDDGTLKVWDLRMGKILPHAGRTRKPGQGRGSDVRWQSSGLRIP